jgi:hypothetical protein
MPLVGGERILQYELMCHPATPMAGVRSVFATAQRPAHRQVAAQFALHGELGAIAMPPMVPQQRADDLWRTTCFEMFIAAVGGSGYLEFNFSPSIRWAAYRFTDYRTGRVDEQHVAVHRVDLRVQGDVLELRVVVDLPGMADDEALGDWEIGLSAVIEARDGTKSFWAVRHPPGDPDFHDKYCFAGILQAPAQA